VTLAGAARFHAPKVVSHFPYIVLPGCSTSAVRAAVTLFLSHVTRVLPLVFLAPDIVQAIYEGRQPAALKVKGLSANLPIEWAEQRRVLGFPAR